MKSNETEAPTISDADELTIEVIPNKARSGLSSEGHGVSKLTALKEVSFLAIPISGVALTTMLGSTFNGLVLAHLGENYLAAGALTTAAQTCVMMLFNSTLFSLSTLISRAVAEGRLKDVGCLVQNGCLLGVIFSIPAIGIFLSVKPILSAFQQPSALVNLSQAYFKTFVIGVPANFVLTSLQQFILGIKQSRFALLNGVIGLAVLISTGYCLAFGKLGLPHLNIEGLGYAQSGRNWFCLLTLSSLFLFLKQFNNYDIFSLKHTNRFQKLKQIFTLGWPISIHAMSEYFSIFTLTMLAGRLGESSLLAQQIAAQYMIIQLMPFLALSQTSNILVSQSVGGKAWQSLKRYGQTSFGLGLVISSTFFISFLIAPNLFISPYIDAKNPNNLSLITEIKPYLYIMLGAQLFESLRTISTGALRGLGDTRTPMIVNAIASWLVGLPLAYLLSSQLGLGVKGIAIAQILSLSMSAILLVDRWRAESKNVSIVNAEDKIECLISKAIKFGQCITRFSYFKQNENSESDRQRDFEAISAENVVPSKKSKSNGWFSFFSRRDDASIQRENDDHNGYSFFSFSKKKSEEKPLIEDEKSKKIYLS